MARMVLGKDIGSYEFDASAQTITFSDITGLRIQDIFLIYNLTDNEKIFQFGTSGYSGTLSDGVLTLDYDTTSMDDADEIQIFIEQGNPEIDFDLGATKTTSITSEIRKTDAEELVDSQELTDTQADFGDEIDMREHIGINFEIICDVNDSEVAHLVVLGKDEKGGTEEYELEDGELVLWDIDASDFKKIYYFEAEAIPYLQVQAYAEVVGTTAGNLTINITKIRR